MNTFSLYLLLGFEHIADFKGYDHILFILTLCAVYDIKNWKKVLVLVTAFTLGHTLTLALATLQILAFSPAIIEFLIPLTIFATGMGNVLQSTETISQNSYYFKYGMALFFGLIHGLGFSNYLRILLGNEDSIVKPLFAFNLGIEGGQLIIVSLILAATYLIVNLAGVKRREWNLILSGAGMGISVILMVERWPW